jgi:tetratricopeptide (TPR) repeat protein
MMMRIILLFLIGISIPWHNLTAASSDWRQNTQLLPPYCKDRAKGLHSAEFKKWRRTLGDAFIHMHHYCSGVFAEQEARSTINQQERQRWLRTVLGEMQYVSNHCSAKCGLYPELHSRWGWALGASGQPAEALKHFQLVIRAKPKYAPAYAKLSDLYIEINQPDEARRVLDEGLKAKPGSSMLQRRLQKLGAQ